MPRCGEGRAGGSWGARSASPGGRTPLTRTRDEWAGRRIGRRPGLVDVAGAEQQPFLGLAGPDGPDGESRGVVELDRPGLSGLGVGLDRDLVLDGVDALAEENLRAVEITSFQRSPRPRPGGTRLWLGTARPSRSGPPVRGRKLAALGPSHACISGGCAWDALAWGWRWPPPRRTLTRDQAVVGLCVSDAEVLWCESPRIRVTFVTPAVRGLVPG